MISQLVSKKGFTLVEIMIVAGVLGLLVAISFPVLLRARVGANESTAKSSLRTISTGCESFRMTQNPPTYPANLVALSAATPPYIDAVLAGGTKQGYTFTYTLVNANQFTCTAAPVTANVTGVNTFFVDETGVVRFNNAAGNPIE
ncbi:MAG: prepilin-type N-terminal cleavage/methylation domain-containing protein [Candidatus Omnitrophica bacterium]|nr:prepilin-type N-terminal cleavage/methylation domain-containing protein [Candidatus Omnitrophota bacterium]